MLLDPSTRDELPDPNASLIISRVIVDAWLQSVSRKQGKKFLENLGRVITTREEMARVVPIRGGGAEQAERQALAAIRQMLSFWLLSLPPK